MQPVRLFTIVAGSVGLAIAAGTLFQPDPAAEPAAEMASAPAPVADPAPTLAGGVPSLSSVIAPSGATMAVPGEDMAEALSQTLPMMANITEIDSETTAPSPLASAPDGADACAVQVSVRANPAAMLGMTLHAPCDAGEPVAIAHGPLRLARMLGEDGRLALDLPALAAQAEVTIGFFDGRILTEGADVPDFGMFPRVVVQWDGPEVLDLHAYAGGAGWGEAGHVKAGDPISAVTGFVTVLGTESESQAQVYTYPAGIRPQEGSVLLEAELAVTVDSCGRPFDVRVQMVRDDAPVSRRDIRVDMPSCDMTGGFVLLPDLLPEALPTMATLN